MEREPRVVRVLAVLPALVAAAGKVVDRVLDARRGEFEAVLRKRGNIRVWLFGPTFRDTESILLASAKLLPSKTMTDFCL